MRHKQMNKGQYVKISHLENEEISVPGNFFKRKLSTNDMSQDSNTSLDT